MYCNPVELMTIFPVFFLVCTVPPTLRRNFKGLVEKSLGFEHKIPCPVKADPRPYTRWLKNGTDLTANDPDDNVSFTKTSIVFKRLRLSDAGLYTCVASNLFGQPIRVNFTLIVVGRWRFMFLSVQSFKMKPNKIK